MDETRASDTAVLVAIQRAAHQLLDDDPKILTDPIAVGLVPGSSEREIRSSINEQLSPMRKLTRSGIILRSRLAEDELGVAANEGIAQYLVLGAGFDTFAFRKPPQMSGVRVVEVDHPATQALKKECLANRGLASEGRVTFCPVDFEQKTLAQGLENQAGLTSAATFVSWLGVTMYLSREAIEETLEFVLSLQPSSRVFLTYFQPPEAIQSTAVREQTASLIDLAANHGEPMVSLFTPQELEDWLLGLGFSHVKHYTPIESEARYFAGREDGLTAHTAGHNLCAFV